MTVVVRLLADVPHLADAVGDLGATWLSPGRDDLPVTFVAVDATGIPLGAVTLDHGPRVVDLVVRADMRDRGIGRALLARMERFAVGRDLPEIWVTAEAAEVDFFERCGWRSTEQDGTRTVLRKAI